MSTGEFTGGQAQLGALANAQIDIIESRANAIASELFATSASLQEEDAGSSHRALVHRLNAAAASVQALAAPARQLRAM
jgi:hypothetical protein